MLEATSVFDGDGLMGMHCQNYCAQLINQSQPHAKMLQVVVTTMQASKRRAKRKRKPQRKTYCPVLIPIDEEHSLLGDITTANELAARRITGGSPVVFAFVQFNSFLTSLCFHFSCHQLKKEEECLWKASACWRSCFHCSTPFSMPPLIMITFEPV